MMAREYSVGRRDHVVGLTVILRDRHPPRRSAAGGGDGVITPLPVAD